MKSLATRLGLLLAMLTMVLAVSVPAMADDEDDFDESFDEGDYTAQVELEDCDIFDEDGDGVDDEEIADGIDNDGFGDIDEDVQLLCPVDVDDFSAAADDDDDDE